MGDDVFAHSRPTEAFISLLNERPEALLQIVALQSVIELTVGKQDPDQAPGDIGFGAKFKPRDEKICRFAIERIEEWSISYDGNFWYVDTRSPHWTRTN